ncbi:chemotaxis protein CheW [Fulvivirga lutimaris]|uniref:chemotaxis protein CheW n=1 Tax=Fulvivirga lutimaris TaxID=1819566 RepID=UPI0012BBD387|nr:chemotaxis protein CheW [Fulvivirga lutimaris]MTI40051.1 purine-binding chemotaxis protein CheW [Fulvivirga lutimaris]
MADIQEKKLKDKVLEAKKLKEENLKNSNQKLDLMQLIAFKQGEEEYAMNIDQIKEVVITPNITKMPQTPEYIKGVANIRGNIIAIMDLEEKFGIKTKEGNTDAAGKNFTLVIESEDLKVGILVKEVPNTLAVSESDIDEAVNVIHSSNVDQNYITGIVKIDDRLVILIDVFKVVNEVDISTTNKIAV